MVAKASQRFLSNIKDYRPDAPGPWRHKNPFLAWRGAPSFTPSSGSFRFEFRLSRFERSGGLELISRGEFEQGAELARAGGVPQLAQGLGFDLADRFAGEGERLAHFLERVLAAVLQPEAHLDDLFLAGGERLQYCGQLPIWGLSDNLC
jgi:hypothetical protein